MQLADRIALTDKAVSSDGYMKVHARAARAGVYDYLGAEVDPEGKRFKADEVVKVYRPADEVFDRASLASFALKPITDGHPSVAVTSANWRDHARGTIVGAVKDGDYVGFDLAFMDAATVAKIESGKRELSNGYSCDLAFEDGVAQDGTAYQAIQRNIRGNHVALVERGRAGPECRVADARWAICDAIPAAMSGAPKEERVTVTNLDGLSVNITDGQAVEQALAALDSKLTKALSDIATLTADKANLATEKATLETQLADAVLTPAKLRDAAAAYARTAEKAKALGVAVTDAMDEAAMMKAAVNAKIGDAAAGWTEAQIAASFATLAIDAKPNDPLRAAVKDGGLASIGDAAAQRDAARNDYIARLTGQKKEAA